jgi:hypothetical protein
MGDVVPLGLGGALPDPDSIWPATTVIEVDPGLANRLGDDIESRAAAVRAAVAGAAAVPDGMVADIEVTEAGAGTILVCMVGDGPAMRALHVVARRRATNAAEALHAVLAARA